MTFQPLKLAVRLTVLSGALSLVACATYSAAPLDLGATGKGSVNELRHREPLPPRLTPDDVARLALDNNPDLIAVRTQHGLAEAQLRAAGILPNPVLGLGYAGVLSGPGSIPALAASLSQDVKAIVTLSARRRAADATASSVDASVLWQEWQLIGKARLAAVDLVEGDKQLVVLRDDAALWHENVGRIRAAVDRGDATLIQLSTEVAAESDAQKQLDEFERAQAGRRRDLNLLLGLAPSAPLSLVEGEAIAPLDEEAIRAALPQLGSRRPDLVALQLGYRAQEENLRAAVLSQFPLFSLGIGYARDTSNVRTLGPQLTMELPVFDRNQGQIAQEQATRERLRAEFEARIEGARGEVEALLDDRAQLQEQLLRRRSEVAAMEPIAARVRVAFLQGDVDARTYVDTVVAANAKRQALFALQLTLVEQQIAIATLVGAGMPPVEMLPVRSASPTPTLADR